MAAMHKRGQVVVVLALAGEGVGFLCRHRSHPYLLQVLPRMHSTAISTSSHVHILCRFARWLPTSKAFRNQEFRVAQENPRKAKNFRGTRQSDRPAAQAARPLINLC